MSDNVGDLEAPKLVVKCSQTILSFFVFLVLFAVRKIHQQHTRIPKRSLW
jgi:hypothetical protein